MTSAKIALFGAIILISCLVQVSLNPAVVKGMAEMATLKKQNKRLQDKMVRYFTNIKGLFPALL